MANLSENEKHLVCQRAIEAKKDIEFRFLELGALLLRIKEERLFEAGWTSWEEYAMELKMRPNTISRLIGIYREFVLRFKIPPAELAAAGGWTVVAELLPDIDDKTMKKDVQNWLGEATDLSRADLRRTIVERRKGVDMAKCSHKNFYDLRICRDCGDRRKI